MSFIGNDARRRRRTRPGRRVALAENSGAATTAADRCYFRMECWFGCLPSSNPLIRAFLFLSSDDTPPLLSSPVLIAFSLSPSIGCPVAPSAVGRARRGERRLRVYRQLLVYFFQSCNALWTHAPTSRAVNLRTTRLSLRNMRSGVGVSLVASAPLGAYLLLSIFLCFLCLLSRLDFPSPTLSARPWTS